MKLKIDKTNAFQYKIENGQELFNSIHKDAYVNASKRVFEIINNSKFNLDLKESNLINYDTNYNNIISFMGDRGAGKSTAAISLAEALVRKETAFLEEPYASALREKKIAKLDLIDPSLFQDNDRLIEIIVSKMFNQFMKKIEAYPETINHDDKRALISFFQEVYQNLRTLHSSKEEIYKKETIEALSELAKGGNLKINFFLLVQKYLKYVENQSDYLLIIIDDFDLNIKGAYEMLEDIRQFLIQYNVIIFVACKIEQLYDAVEQSIRLSVSTLTKNNGKTFNNSPEEMTAKYLLKLFPINSRCYINPLQFDTTKFELEIDKEELNSGEVEKDILKKIYNSTGILMIPSDNKHHPIIPRNLREFIQFYIFIQDLHSSTDLKHSKLSLFKSYLINYWTNVNLSKEKSQIIHLLSSKDVVSKNKYIINELKNLGKEARSPFGLDKDISDILETDNNEANISIGDVLSVIRFYENELFSVDEQLLLFAVKLYYSIEITELHHNSKQEKLRAILGNNIYSNADKNLISRMDINDYWSFNFRHLAQIENQTDFNVKEFLASFIISLKKSVKRSDPEIIHLISSSNTRGNTDIVFSILAFLMNIWIWEEHFYKVFGKQERFERELKSEQLIPCFSVDLIDRIIYDLKTEEIKVSYKESYFKIIEHVFSRVKMVLAKTDSIFDNLGLYTKFETSDFNSQFKRLSPEIEQKLNEIKASPIEYSNDEMEDLITIIQKNYTPEQLEQLKGKVNYSIDYYSWRYFDNPRQATSQGAKQAMNNLIRDFIPFKEVHSKLTYYRRLMDNNYVDGLLEIKTFLDQLANLGSNG